MSQENVEIVRRCLEALQDDEETWLQTLDPGLVRYPIEDAGTEAAARLSGYVDARRLIRKPRAPVVRR
jgi:hypothetical protein